MSAAPVWLYDGVCVLCSGSVRYALGHERDHAMRFVAIQSREGRALAARHGADPDDPESFLFIEDGRALAKSDAVLALAAHLNGPARLLVIGRIMPKALRDWLYDRVARNRYRIFGRKTVCETPDPAHRHRFAPSETE
ncbi:putative DCC family thiol-disulfide oxidoreductase YuxK [Methylopila capsulata]|uniref:Thiol-disulfide oxidoreductase n=1 Tax=Methylopila capsulata TaxID=61654 RepID=A0A9W6IW07_9HYPH|nr:thiol-disulfide oxidoreductase DCC family protein [Methylopila capsulata]MBM7853155.1 putative DCC family thiol-disulfide oxidoreductase YuxK [Methylopila capsulata]GLK57631.1 thiol-disulfide oxidoreductase [Methylopila capsulata]